MDTKREHSAAPPAAESEEAGAEREAAVDVAAGSADKNDVGGILVNGEPELLYAVNFSVAPPREGDKPMQLSAEVSQSL